jgi:integrase
MSDLRDHAQEYLGLRRSLGYKLTGEGQLLAHFVAFAEGLDAPRITTGLAVGWVNQATNAGRAYRARRMRVVRGFARHLQAFQPDTEVPAADLFTAGKHRPTPYIYSDADIADLMSAARELSPRLRAATMETLIGLLAATGMRVGEAMALDRADLDWDSCLVTIRQSKYTKSREVLLHTTTLEALRAYGDQRDRLSPRPGAPSLFVSSRGSRLAHPTIYGSFRQLLRRTGLETRSGSRPRVHGLRHTFAVNTLLRWFRDGADVEARMPLLSTYLGHACPAASYWYLSAVPELLELAAARLQAYPGGRR